MKTKQHTVPFVDVLSPNRPIADDIKTAMGAVVHRGDFTLGQDVSGFEEEFAAYCGADFSVGVGTGTDALHLALQACGIGAGDEVITAANTFIATAEAIVMAGAKPVLVDMDEATYNIDARLVAQALTDNTRAIIPVHLYGQVADMSEIWEIANDRDLVIIEDACQAHGATYHGKRAGSMGHVAAFSFYPSKNLGAFGDGGAVVTSDEEIAKQVRRLRNHGETKKYEHAVSGYCTRLHSLQAAVLRVKLPLLDGWNESRRAAAALYDGLLADVVKTPHVAEGRDHVYHLYVVRHPDRDGLQSFLGESGIGAGIHYPVPIHLQRAFEWLDCPEGTFPVAERAAGEILSLPMYPGLDEHDVRYVCSKVAEFAA